MKSKIICVDSDQAFSAILKEGLEGSGDYQVKTVSSGAEALQAMGTSIFDLAVVDLGIEDIHPLELVAAIRETYSSIRLVLIPLFGRQVPDEMRQYGISGLLPKPFFVDELPEIVGRAIEGKAELPAEVFVQKDLTLPVDAEDDILLPADIDDNPGSDILGTLPVEFSGGDEPFPDAGEQPSTEKKIASLLKDLDREVQADAIIVTVGGDLVATAGTMELESAAQLARLILDGVEASARAASFLGEPGGKFEQTLHEGKFFRLYSVNLGDGAVLALALSSDTALGTLRYRVRQTAEEIASILS